MAARFTVVLDACVLYPAQIRDSLLRLAAEGFYRPLWSQDIHREWINAIRRELPDIDPNRLERTKSLMDENFEDAVVEGYECLIETIDLPDPDDRHVVAAAVKENADAIVTSNLKDFPEETLLFHNLEVIHPDDFIRYQFDLDQSLFLHVMRTQRTSLQNPPLSTDEFIGHMEASGLVLTADLLKEFDDEI